MNSAGIASDGTITVSYMLADPNGLPLDKAGVQTPGTISTSFVAGVLPQNVGDYATYTTTTASGAALGSIQQPGADSGGTISFLGSGQYQYVFHTKAPSGFDATATHTIGIYGSRNLTAYNLGTNYASTTYNFVPNGAKVTHIHDIIETASCNACHDQLSAHGGSRRGMNMCVLCHKPQNIDPNNGQTFDAKVFFHKIHMGASLPSVMAGGTYSVTNSLGTFDYSTVVFPADPGDPRRCEICHSQTTGAAQATAFLTNPTRAACGSCHDDVNFATGANHPGGPQFDDNHCATCHIPQGEMDFDASIHGRARGADRVDVCSRGLAVNITKVAERHGRQRAGGIVHGAGQQQAAGFRFRRWARSRSPWRGRRPTTATPVFGSDVTHARLCDRKRRAARLATPAATACTPSPYRSGESDGHLCDRRRGAAHRSRPGRDHCRNKASNMERRTRWCTSRWTARRWRRGARWWRSPTAISAT